MRYSPFAIFPIYVTMWLFFSCNQQPWPQPIKNSAEIPIEKVPFAKAIAENGDHVQLFEDHSWIVDSSFTFKEKRKKVPATVITSRRNKVYSSEASGICGARTKKGGACHRRVAGGGRCWQHS